MAEQREESVPQPEAVGNPSGTPPHKASRWRRIVGATLLVLGVVLVPVSLSAVWVRNTLLDTDNYVATVGPLAGTLDIQHGIVDRVTTALFADGEAKKKIAAALPERAQVLIGPIATGLESATNAVALRLLQSDRFQTLWENVEPPTHAAVIKVLTGGGSRASTKVAPSRSTSNRFSPTLSGALTRGITVLDDAQLPAKYKNFVLLQSKDLEKVQGGVDLLQELARVLPVVALLCVGGAVALSSNRRRTVLRAGIWIAVAVGIQLALLSVGRNFYLDAITAAGARPGSAGAVWDQLTSFLRVSGRTMIVVALVVAIAAWLAGPRDSRSGPGTFGTEASEEPVHEPTNPGSQPVPSRTL